MKRTLCLAVLSILVMMVLAPMASAQDNLQCLTYESQAEAQQRLKEDPSDPDGLDGPPGEAFTGTQGVACEDLPSPKDLTPVLPTTNDPDPVPFPSRAPNLVLSPENDPDPVLSPDDDPDPDPSPDDDPDPVLATGNAKAQAGNAKAQAGNVKAQDRRDSKRLLEAGGDLPLPQRADAGSKPDEGGSWPLVPVATIFLSACLLVFLIHRIISHR